MVPMQLLCGPSICHTATWTLWTTHRHERNLQDKGGAWVVGATSFADTRGRCPSKDDVIVVDWHVWASRFTGVPSTVESTVANTYEPNVTQPQSICIAT